MKKIISICLILAVALMITGCASKKATFGEGDTKFSTDLVEGNYQLNAGTGNDVVISGNVSLKLCNEGEKELPFVLDKESGGIFVEFNQDDIKNVSTTWINSIQKIQITSDEGLINLIPGKCPTYPFSFRTPIGTDPTGKYGGFSKQAFKNAKYYFFIGDKKFELKGQDNLYTVDDAKKEAGLTDAEITQIADKYQAGYNKLAPYCTQTFKLASMASECTGYVIKIAYADAIPKGKEAYCKTLSANKIAICQEALTKSGDDWSGELQKYIDDAVATAKQT